MTDERERLARYQAQLLDILHSERSPAEACKAIQEIAAEANLPNGVQSVDIRMVDVAMHLTKRWGVTKN